LRDLGNAQLFTAYAIDKFQPVLTKFTSANDFLKQYEISDDDFNRFILYASKTIKEMDPHEVLTSKRAIKTLLKAHAARLKWGDNAYFEAMNINDVTLQKAIAAIE